MPENSSSYNDYNINYMNYNIDAGNAAPVLEQGREEDAGRDSRTLREVLRSNKIVVGAITVILMLVIATASVNSAAVASNRALSAAQNEVAALRSSLDSKKTAYASKLSGIDIDAYAKNKLGMVNTGEAIEITLTEIAE